MFWIRIGPGFPYVYKEFSQYLDHVVQCNYLELLILPEIFVGEIKSKMKILKLNFILLILLVSCSLDKPKVSNNVVKDFNLGWWSELRYQGLYLNNDHSEFGGSLIIPETVYAIGFNQEFIIAKQHPNLKKEVEPRLTKQNDGYLFTHLPDTAYFNSDLLIKSNGNILLPLDSYSQLEGLFPYKNITHYWIVDIRNYRLRFWKNEGNIFGFTTEEEYQNKRTELGIPGELDYSFFFEELE